MDKIKTTKKRDYKAEYQRRRELGNERGLSIAQARGHTRKDEAKISELKRSGVIDRTRKPTFERYYQVIQSVASGKSLSKAVREAHISIATIKKLDADRHALHRSNKRQWQIRSSAIFPILNKEGTLSRDVPLDRKNARIMGQYWNAANNAYLGDTSSLSAFKNTIVFDLQRKQYHLLTEVDDLISIMEQMNDAEREAFERMFSSEQRAFGVMNHG